MSLMVCMSLASSVKSFFLNCAFDFLGKAAAEKPPRLDRDTSRAIWLSPWLSLKITLLDLSIIIDDSEKLALFCFVYGDLSLVINLLSSRFLSDVC